jgi:hypothetical protein
MRRIALGLVLTALLGSGCAFSFAFVSPNLKLKITNVSASPVPVPVNGESALSATVDNPQGEKLTYTWTAHAGTVIGNGSSARYLTGACCTSTDVVALVVKNQKGETDTHLMTLTVLQPDTTSAP